MDRWKPRNEAYALSRDTVQVHRRASANKQTILSSDIEDENNCRSDDCITLSRMIIGWLIVNFRLFLNEYTPYVFQLIINYCSVKFLKRRWSLERLIETFVPLHFARETTWTIGGRSREDKGRTRSLHDREKSFSPTRSICSDLKQNTRLECLEYEDKRKLREKKNFLFTTRSSSLSRYAIKSVLDANPARLFPRSFREYSTGRTVNRSRRLVLPCCEARNGIAYDEERFTGRRSGSALLFRVTPFVDRHASFRTSVDPAVSLPEWISVNGVEITADDTVDIVPRCLVRWACCDSALSRMVCVHFDLLLYFLHTRHRSILLFYFKFFFFFFSRDRFIF